MSKIDTSKQKLAQTLVNRGWKILSQNGRFWDVENASKTQTARIAVRAHRDGREASYVIVEVQQ